MKGKQKLAATLLLLTLSTTKSETTTYAASYINLNDLVAVNNIQNYYRLDLPYQFDNEINFNSYFGRDVAYLVYTLGQNISDRPVPGSPTISDLNGLILNTNNGGLSDWETGDYLTIYTDVPCYILVKNNETFLRAIEDIAYDIGDDFGIGRALTLVSIENVVNDYQEFLTNRIEVSAIEEYYYNLGYEQGYYVGMHEDSEPYKISDMIYGAFNGITSILNIRIFDRITLGQIVFIPISFGALFLVLKLVAKD